MLRDITIGQYYKTKSILHDMDPRSKIILLVVMMIVIFSVDTVAEYALLILMSFLCIRLSRVPAAYILKGMKPVWVLVIFTAVINLFMGGGENTIVQWGSLKITYESVMLALSMMMRVILLVVFSTLLTLTTSPMTLTTGIEKLLKPLEKIKFPSHEVAMMMSIALRFIPTLTQEAEKIMKAQKARGNDFETGGFLKKVRGMIPLFVPLFISAFRRADDLAMAMEARCYHGGANRTSFKILKYKKCDYAAFAVVGVFLCVIIILRVVG